MMRIIFSKRKQTVSTPAIFIDRDGVINCRRPGDYVLEWSQFVFIPGMREALKALSALRLPVIVISNQSAVGRRLLKPSALRQITSQFHQALADDGTPLMAVYYCTHKPGEGCTCRKPKPGMLFRAASDFKLDLSRSIFIGDSDTDIQAARLAGCQPVLFGPGLSANSHSLDWTTGLPVARTAGELFQVAQHSLHAAERAAARDRAAGG